MGSNPTASATTGHICARSSVDTANIRSAQATNAFVHYFTHALVAQRIERPVAVREATGSIPVERAIKYPTIGGVFL